MDQVNSSQQEVLFLLSNHRSAIEAAFDAYLHQDEPSPPVDESLEEVFEENESYQHSLPQPEKEGIMYIYQGVSTGQPKPPKRELYPSNYHSSRQLKQELLREVLLLQQQELWEKRSLPKWTSKRGLTGRLSTSFHSYLNVNPTRMF